jgi:tight adherence protein B
MALAVDVNQRYGGSIKALLNSITVMVRQREQARREFSALTGETRFSAWVLGILPIAVAAYMAAINPGYIESMWVSDEGRNILYFALGFQVTGSLILWKMMKSI